MKLSDADVSFLPQVFPVNPSIDLVKEILAIGGYFFELTPIGKKVSVVLSIIFF